MAYETVNAQWPADTDNGRALKPTPQEAVSAARRLYRFAMKRPFKGRVKITSGNRATWIRGGVLYVNPDWHGGGWHEVVHTMSHYCGYKLHPGKSQHGTQHAFLEREMIAYAVRSGWLDGKLRRSEKPPQISDKRVVKAARLAARLKRWETKHRRATTAIRKLTRQARRLEQQSALTLS